MSNDTTRDSSRQWGQSPSKMLMTVAVAATFEIAVNREVVGKLPKESGGAAWERFNTGFETVRLCDRELLAEIRAGYAIAPVHRDKRKRANFVSAQHIGLDFDTEDDRSRLDTLAADPFIAQHATFIHTTASHRPDAPRARVVFILDRPITDPDRYAETVEALVDRFDLADQAAKDPARAWFGAPDCESRWLGNTLSLEVLEAEVLPPYRKQRAAVMEAARLRRAAYASRSDAPSLETIADALGYIPPRGEYDDWSHALMAIHSVYPGAEGVALAEGWSPGYRGEVESKFRSFSQDGGITIGTLFAMAKKHGWPGPSSNGHKPKILPWSQTGAAIPMPPTEIVPVEGDSGEEGGWLADYVRYADRKSPMSPMLFHEGAGLWLLSVAVARRVVVRMTHDDVFPNLFIAPLAPTTLYQKSTGMKVARELALSAFPHLLAPQESTPEALLADLAGRQPANYDDLPDDTRALWQVRRAFAAQQGLYLDEFSGLLTGAGRDYNAGLLETLLRLYDCEARFTRSTRGQGLVEVRDAYLSFLGGSTPTALAAHLSGHRLWTNGWWPRFALLTPEGLPEWRESESRPDATDITRRLAQLYQRLPIPQWPQPVRPVNATLSDEACNLWRGFDKWARYDAILDGLDERLNGVYGRLPTHALKVATLLAAIEWADRETAGEAGIEISAKHMRRALGIVERWRASAHRLLDTVDRRGQLTLRDQILARIQQWTPTPDNHPDQPGPTPRDLDRMIQTAKGTQIKAELARLVADGEIELTKWKNPRGGPETDCFRRAGMNDQESQGE